MRYAIVNLTREEVDFVAGLLRTLDEVPPPGVDLENVRLQSEHPAAQDEPMGEIWASAVFGEGDDGGG